MTKTREILKQFWGYEAFRPGQEDVVNTLAAGRDTLAIMPTGAGKSICYQDPALFYFLRGEGGTIVVSPLISLMDDQIAHLRARGIPAAAIHSGLSAGQIRSVLKDYPAGKYALLYAAPERLISPSFREAVREARTAMLVVDEAHCVAKWGPSFRPAYREIPAFVSILQKRPVMAAFTATADGRVKAEILRALGLREPFIEITGFDRPNLYYGIEYPKDKRRAVLRYIREHSGSCGIIYCATRRTVEELAAYLTRAGVRVLPYHAGLPADARERNMKAFMDGSVRVMTATNAFGMGIDKPDIRFVLHYHMPRDMESYYQEAGRAGRDGLPAECILFYRNADRKIGRFFIRNEPFAGERAKGRKALRVMRRYAAGRSCLRRYILSCFGEGECADVYGSSHPAKGRAERNAVAAAGCGQCSVCQRRHIFPYPWEEPDERIPGRAGGAGEIPASGLTSRLVHSRFPFFRNLGMRIYDALYPHVQFSRRENELYEDLVALRAMIGKDKGIRPDRIFPDSVLRDMTRTLPLRKTDLFFLSNIKWLAILRFGDEFLEEIRTHVLFYRLD